MSFHSAYQSSIEQAQWLGYVRVEDKNAFMGAYYIKNGKKWIYNLEALGKKLGATCHFDFIRHGYAIEDYLLFHNTSIEEMLEIYYGTDSEQYRTYMAQRAERIEQQRIQHEEDFEDMLNRSYDAFLSFIAEECGGYLGDGMRISGGSIYEDRP